MKKLLILGCSTCEISIINRAKELGVYTIVTDRNTDYRKSPAKNFADEHWDIDWSHTEELAEKCIEENVSGITAGFNELQIDSMIRLCERLGKPSYATFGQLEIIRNKMRFKSMCRECGIPVINDYSSPDEVNHFPVIVKPSDRCGAIGIAVADDREELKAAYENALTSSIEKQVVIEDCITDSQEVNVQYAVIHGTVSMLSTFDTYISEKGKIIGKTVTNGVLYPSKYESDCCSTMNQGVENMVRKMKIQDGILMFSGFMTNDGIRIFEGAFRLGAYQNFKYCSIRHGFHYLDIFINHALYGSEYTLDRVANTDDDVKCVTLGIYLKNGVVDSVEGETEVKAIPELTRFRSSIYRGMICGDSLSMYTSLLTGMEFIHKDPQILAQDVHLVNVLYHVKNQNGEDMIFDRVNPEKVSVWWD